MSCDRDDPTPEEAPENPEDELEAPTEELEDDEEFEDDEELEDERPEWDDRPRPPDHHPRRGPGRGQIGLLPDHDPYWQFGMPVESWGSTVKRPGRREPRQDQGPRAYLECGKCGVKVERKREHSRNSRCPMCGRPMRLSQPIS